ncbi:unnamed protein product, partial [Owenia fusiformis]
MASELTWLPAVCGNSSRKWAFWDNDLTINTTTPEFTLCFQYTVTVWVPSAYLWLILPFFAIYLNWLPTVNTWRDKSWINFIKIFLGSLITVTLIVDFALRLASDPTEVAVYLASILLILTSLLATILSHIEYSKRMHTSSVLVIYWSLACVG